jgi:ABC-type transporter Mla maintaining outer membrane lipid asymmetry ATPase subunit MlaF
MRTAEYMGILFRSGLVRFASKEEMTVDRNPIIRQFLAGRAAGPIGMDEMVSDTNDRWSSEAAAHDDEIMTV